MTKIIKEGVKLKTSRAINLFRYRSGSDNFPRYYRSPKHHGTYKVEKINTIRPKSVPPNNRESLKRQTQRCWKTQQKTRKAWDK